MKFTDLHMHSNCSFDGNYPIEDMAQAALDAGLDEICLTDHCDLLEEDGALRLDYDWQPVRAQLEQARARFEGRLVIRKGIEFGSGFVSAPHAQEILSEAGLDFVIGSAHNMTPETGGRDFYFEDFSTKESVHAILDNYMDALVMVAQSPYYDVIGHIIYPLRYVPDQADMPKDLSAYWERVVLVMQAAIAQGKGIEVNTYCGRTIAPWRPVLEEYKRLGGEILTFGSDAHHTENVGRGIREAMQLAKDCGFRAHCCYEGRKAQFIDLE